jgi:hypothetical protein
MDCRVLIQLGRPLLGSFSVGLITSVKRESDGKE